MGYYRSEETIAAIATAPGEGAVAIVRLSGKQSLHISAQIFSRDPLSFVSHTAYYGKILDSEGSLVDEVLLIPMHRPRSYTGEDVVEIHCHGGGLTTRKVLDAVVKAGARVALPGEFTFRAYLNGKLDLAKAEAIQQIICAKNSHALSAATHQLQGALSEKIQTFQRELTDLAAILEAWIDFPEEGLEFATVEEMCASLEKVIRDMSALEKSFHHGQKIHSGISLCLAGRPNVGKSSLMNVLLRRERAIVTEIPGTTRDLLEEELLLGGLHFRLIDTAGIRNTEEIVEQEGIRRSKQAMEQADLILLILDASEGLTEEDRQLLCLASPHKTILVWNKIDLPHHIVNLPKFELPILLSARSKQGVEQLTEKIDKKVWQDGPPSKEEVIITNVRHKQALSDAIASCKALITGLRENISPEFVCLDMRSALKQLATIIGTDVTEDVLNAIFSKFCVGK